MLVLREWFRRQDAIGFGWVSSSSSSSSSYLTKRNKGILGSVVVVNVQVAAGAQAHAPAAVLGQGVQHVVEEADARVDADGLRLGLLGGVFEGGAIDAVELGQGAAVEVERELDLGLVGVAVEDGRADALFGRHGGRVGWCLFVCGGLIDWLVLCILERERERESRLK
jgi:hypothetical protein